MHWTRIFFLVALSLPWVASAKEASGSLRGELVFSDQTAPEAFTLSLSRIRAGSFSSDSPDSKYLTLEGSTFSLNALPEGRYRLTLLGEDFIDLTIEEVLIEGNKETNLGALVLSRGRTIKGVVSDSQGKPVSGATVLAGESLFLYDQEKPLTDRQAKSAADGSFLIQALPEAPLLFLATHPTQGWAPVVRVEAKQREVRLVVQETGEVSGTIRYDGKKTAGVVTAVPLLDGKPSKAHLFVRTFEGSYLLHALPAGEYLLIADLNKDGTEAIYLPSKTEKITIKPKEKQGVDLAIPRGTTLTITVTLSSPKDTDWISFYLLPGKKTAKSAAELEALSEALGPEALRQTSMHVEEKHALIEDVLAGSYTLCAYTTRAGSGEEPVKCQPLVVQKSAHQSALIALKAPPRK